eukprot:scaffold18279_cov54-Cyclotella_meneghiniana.AAC.2
MIQIGRMTVTELKESLRARGLKVSGTKSELLERLTTNVRDINNHSNHNQLVSTDNDEIMHPTELQQLPKIVRDEFIKYTTKDDTVKQPNLLPIQQKSYQHIADGGDTVLFSPTGTGKTLAYILPLAVRLLEWKRDGSLAKKSSHSHKRRNLGNRNDSMASEHIEPATPSILVMEPSRELARQVGKVWTRFHPTATKSSKKHVVTVYGGVPMTRHASLLNSKTDVVIGTPGRIKELIREKYLSTEHLKAIVLDEADSLLNFADVPEVEWLLEGMQNDYQLILASATINERVHLFVDEIMEISVGEEGYVVVNAESANNERSIHKPEALSSQPEVRHWSMAASASSRVPLAADLILTIAPRRGIIFAPSKAEVEKVAQELSERISADHSIHILHGDMVQAARSRTVAAFRGDQIMSDSTSKQQQSAQMTRILVATDVASRGLDLPAVDLVLQFGVPRRSGKDGTFDSELYIHRTGRAGRFGNTRTSDVILFYDSSVGERSTMTNLKEEMKRIKDVDILPRPLPTPNEVMDASFNRAIVQCQGFRNEITDELVQYFKDRLTEDGISSDASDNVLLDRLACAMAALSGLPQAVRARSLLTADQRDRTIRIWTESGDSLTPPEVTEVVKSMGSGKLGRISICEDGSAVFDLSAKRAEKLLQTARDDEGCRKSGWHFELPTTLPPM